MRWLLVLGLVACGETTAEPDAGDASTVPDAAADVAALASACRIDGSDYACKPGSSWAWGDASTKCFDSPCPVGSSCSLLGIDASAGVCE